MSKRQIFLQEVEQLFKINDVSEESKEYLETLKNASSSSAPITEKGKEIITFMRESEEKFDNKFLARQVAEGLFTSSRSVSGSMRKLVNDEFVSKSKDSPIIYSLTEKGRTFEL